MDSFSRRICNQVTLCLSFAGSGISTAAALVSTAPTIFALLGMVLSDAAPSESAGSGPAPHGMVTGGTAGAEGPVLFSADVSFATAVVEALAAVAASAANALAACTATGNSKPLILFTHLRKLQVIGCASGRHSRMSVRRLAPYQFAGVRIVGRQVERTYSAASTLA